MRKNAVINLELSKDGNLGVKFYAKQYDDIKIKATIYDGLNVIDVSGQEVILYIKKPDGTIIEQMDNIKIVDKEIIINASSQATAVLGECELEIILRDVEGETSTSTISYMVIEKLSTAIIDVIQSSNDLHHLKLIEEFIERADNSISSIDKDIKEIQELISNIEGNINTEYTEIIKALTDLKDELINNINNEVDSLKTETIEDLEEVKEDIINMANKALGDANEAVETATEALNTINDIKTEVDKIPELVEDAKKDIEKIKEDALDDMSTAHMNIDAAKDEAINLVNSTKINAVNKINEAKADGVSALNASRASVISEINVLYETISNEANALKQSTVDEINMLSETVSNNINDLGGSISNDINALGESAVSNINHIKDEILEDTQTEANNVKISTINTIEEESTNIKNDAIKMINDEKSSSISLLNSSKEEALSSIDSIKGESVLNINTSKEEAISDINNLKNDTINELDNHKEDIVKNVLQLKEDTLNTISEKELEAISNIDIKKDEAVTRVTTEKDTALEEISQKIADVLSKINDLDLVTDELMSTNEDGKVTLNNLLDAIRRAEEITQEVELYIESKSGNHDDILAEIEAIKADMEKVKTDLNSIDLTPYATTEQVEGKIDEAVNTIEIPTIDHLATKKELEESLGLYIDDIGEDPHPACYKTEPEMLEKETHYIRYKSYDKKYRVTYLSGYIEPAYDSYVSNNKVHIWRMNGLGVSYRTFVYEAGTWNLVSNDAIIRVFGNSSDINTCLESVYSTNIRLMNKNKTEIIVDIKEYNPQQVPINNYNNATNTGNYYVYHQNAISNSYVDNIEGILSVSNTKGFIKQELSSLDGEINAFRTKGTNGWTAWSTITPEIDLSVYPTVDEMNEAIANIEIPEVDLSPYATKEEVETYRGKIGEDIHPAVFKNAPKMLDTETGYIRLKFSDKYDDIYRVYYFEETKGMNYSYRGEYNPTGEYQVLFTRPWGVPCRIFECKGTTWTQVESNNTYIQIADNTSGDWKNNVYSSNMNLYSKDWNSIYLEAKPGDPANAPLNDYNGAVETGDYKVHHTEAINNSYVDTIDGILIVRNADKVVYQQLISDDSSINVFRMRKEDGVWTAWSTITPEIDIPEIDLSDYATKEELNTVNNAVEELKTLLGNVNTDLISNINDIVRGL